jgi:hypothetical protein
MASPADAARISGPHQCASSAPACHTPPSAPSNPHRPRGVSITVSATPDENVSPQTPLSFSAEVPWPRTEAAKVADAMNEAPRGFVQSLLSGMRSTALSLTGSV